MFTTTSRQVFQSKMAQSPSHVNHTVCSYPLYVKSRALYMCVISTEHQSTKNTNQIASKQHFDIDLRCLQRNKTFTAHQNFHHNYW